MFCFVVVVLKKKPQKRCVSVSFGRRLSWLPHSPGAPQVPTRKDCLCAHSPLRFFTFAKLVTSADPLLACQLRRWLKLYSKYFLSCLAFKLFHLKSHSEHLISSPSGHGQLLKNISPSLPPAWLPDAPTRSITLLYAFIALCISTCITGPYDICVSFSTNCQLPEASLHCLLKIPKASPRYAVDAPSFFPIIFSILPLFISSPNRYLKRTKLHMCLIYLNKHLKMWFLKNCEN